MPGASVLLNCTSVITSEFFVVFFFFLFSFNHQPLFLRELFSLFFFRVLTAILSTGLSY